jgi:hypothetical protein
MTTVTTSVSRPVQIFAVLGVVGALGFAVLNFMGGTSDASTTPAPALQPTTPSSSPLPTPPPAKPAHRRSATTETRSGFPAAVDSALRRKKIVVVAVYMPRASVDLVVRNEAQAAAASAGAAFVAIRATNERAVRPLLARVGVIPDPAVLVVERPGVVAAQLGVTDRGTIAQAVAQARK